MKRIILSVAVILVVALGALAACGKSDEKQAVAPPAPDQGEATQKEIAPVNDADARAQEADLIESLREKSGVLTPEEQVAIIERVRMNAEAAAKAVGQTAQQAMQAGEAAVAAAKRSFEKTQP